MRYLALLTLLLCLPGVLLADDDPKKKSKFDQDKEKEKEPEDEGPKPQVIPFKDYRLQMETPDVRWWKELEIKPEEKEKYGLVLRMMYKLPKSEQHADIQMSCQAFSHKGGIKFNDGSTVGSSNYKAFCDKRYEADLEEWKGVKKEEKPKAARLSRDVKKAYRFAFIGIPPNGGTPMYKQSYFFKYKDKTYMLTFLIPTAAAKKERVTGEVDALLKSLKARKKKR